MSYLMDQLAGAERRAECAKHDALGAIAEYVQALKDHDWSFEFSDDHAAYIRGTNSLARLRRMQRELDSEYVLWDAHAPAAYRVRLQGMVR